MNIKMMMEVVLRILGISAFKKDASNKMVLEEAQETKLKETFGEEFAKVFATGLSEFAESNATQNAPAATDAGGDLSEKLMAALRNHNAKTLDEQMSEAITKISALETKNQTLENLVNALSNSDEEIPGAQNLQEFKGKAGVPPVMKVNKSFGHYAKVHNFLRTGSVGTYANTSIEVEDLRTEFGTFLNTERNLEILAKIFVDFTSSKYFTTKLAVTEWRATQDLITSVVQQFTAKWSAAGKTKFTPITIKNRRHKINVPITPADVLDSYMFYLYDEKLSPDQMPITKYIIENLIKPQILQDIELRMICKGKYVESTDPTVATPPEEAMDGLETILVEAKASNNKGVNFFAGANGFNFKTATHQEILDHVENFVDWISPIYQTVQMNIFCSNEFYKRYKRAYKKVWGVDSGQSGDFGSDKVDFSNNVLVPLAGMYGSPILFATPKANMIKLRYKNEAPNIINDVQKSDYDVKVFGEFWLGVGFAIGEAVFAYVPAGYSPVAKITEVHGESDLFPGEEDSEASGA